MVALPVVDAFEAIKIKHDQSGRLVRKPTPPHQAFAGLEEAATVGNTG
jgi:hypothetical protein